VNLQDLFNLAARSGKASTVFVKEPTRPSYLDTAAQYAAPSTVFVKPQKKSEPNFLQIAAKTAGPSTIFDWSKQADGRPDVGSAATPPPAPALPPYAGATPSGARGIVQGVTRGGQVDRTQSDLYRQYALNPQGQFDRYFGGGEMDRYFGSASRGKGAPQDLAAMQALAGQAKAPMDTPLATYYRAQSAAGRGSMDDIISALEYQGPMAEWARANPMLAQRVYAKKFPGGAATQFLGKEGAAPTADYTAGAFDTSALAGTDPINKPFELLGGALNQGLRVSEVFSEANKLAAQKTNPQNATSQMPIGSRAEDFLQNLGVLKTKPGQGAFGI
jgi:hypothetical protein